MDVNDERRSLPFRALVPGPIFSGPVRPDPALKNISLGPAQGLAELFLGPALVHPHESMMLIWSHPWVWSQIRLHRIAFRMRRKDSLNPVVQFSQLGFKRVTSILLAEGSLP